jgi:hypothetical protein
MSPDCGEGRQARQRGCRRVATTSTFFPLVTPFPLLCSHGTQNGDRSSGHGPASQPKGPQPPSAPRAYLENRNAENRASVERVSTPRSSQTTTENPPQGPPAAPESRAATPTPSGDAPSAESRPALNIKGGGTRGNAASVPPESAPEPAPAPAHTPTPPGAAAPVPPTGPRRIGGSGAGGTMLARAMQDSGKRSGTRGESRTERGEGRGSREREARLAEPTPRKRTANGESKAEGGNLFGQSVSLAPVYRYGS